jgi:hypothetical protein
MLELSPRLAHEFDLGWDVDTGISTGVLVDVGGEEAPAGGANDGTSMSPGS